MIAGFCFESKASAVCKPQFNSADIQRRFLIMFYAPVLISYLHCNYMNLLIFYFVYASLTSG